MTGVISDNPAVETRDEHGRWTGGSVRQWVEELTYAVEEHSTRAFIYVSRPGQEIDDLTLNRWTHEIAPALRETRAAPDIGDGCQAR